MEFYSIFADTLRDVRSKISNDEYNILNRKILTFCKNVKKFKEEEFDLDIYLQTFDVESGNLIEYFNYLDEIKEKINDSSYIFLSNKIQEICKDLKKPNLDKYESKEKFRDFEYMCSISKLFQNYVNAETKLDLQRIPIPGKSGSHVFIDLIRMDRALEIEYEDIEYNHQRRTILFVIRLDYIMRNVRILEGEQNFESIYRNLIDEKLAKDKFFRRILRDSDFDHMIWLNMFSDFSAGKLIFPEEDIKDTCKCNNNFSICYGKRELLNCKNYERFVKMNPIIEHIYDKQKPMILEKEPFYGECLPEVIILKNRENLLQLIYAIPDRYCKNIIMIALADFLMRNAKFLKNNHKQAVMASSGIIGSENDQDFLEILKEIGFDVKIWVNTFVECAVSSMGF